MGTQWQRHGGRPLGAVLARVGALLLGSAVMFLAGGLFAPVHATVGTPEGCVLVQGTPFITSVDPTNGGGIGGTSCTYTVRDNDHFFGSGAWQVKVTDPHGNTVFTFGYDSAAPFVSTPDQNALFAVGDTVSATLTAGELSVGSGTGT